MPKTAKTLDKCRELRTLHPPVRASELSPEKPASLGQSAPVLPSGGSGGRLVLRTFVAGHPLGQGSMRSLGKGRMTHNNPQLRAWRSSVAWEARLAHGCRQLEAGPVSVSANFSLRPRRKGDSPDLDKLVRAVLDALTGVVYVDDRQVAHLEADRLVDPALDLALEGVLLTVEYLS